ncbi:hypothetical protein TSAR_001056 [Trichomalopsis sarcophagae]|uniref:Protein kinase domain-containing protein n=1 Tax=Trichomalopsis sarcophagae TaxID=543379 RepID=A0A232FH52_9HYME|nr:hypothetical protein TSAR_001056 [Trichomalopsis sarcophagae]
MRTSFDTKYKVLDKIGEGTFSEVLRCQDRQTGALYATKRLKKIYQSVSEILESPELLAMRSVTHHPNVLCMIECHYDALPGRLSLVFELMDMSLYDFMENQKGRLLPEMRVKNYVYQLLRGLDHLHRHGIFHRDVKPENILLKGNLLKLGDLGSVRAICVQPPYTEYISTRWYRSPECLLTGGFYGPKMDVWAAGCVFFELLALEPLFPGENEVDQIARIHNVLGTPHARLLAKFRRSSRSSIVYFPSREGRGLLSCLLQKRVGRFSIRGLELLGLMLRYDPDSRAPARKLLEHPYFAEMREPSMRRQTRSSLMSSGERIDDWRYSMELIGHLDTERSRKLKVLTYSICAFEACDTTRLIRSGTNADVAEGRPLRSGSIETEAQTQRGDPAELLPPRQLERFASSPAAMSAPSGVKLALLTPNYISYIYVYASKLTIPNCRPSSISHLPSIFPKPSTSARSFRQPQAAALVPPRKASMSVNIGRYGRSPLKKIPRREQPNSYF